MEKPPQPKSAEKRVSGKLSESKDYGEYESLLVLDILQEEADLKFDKSVEDLEKAEKVDLTAPETLTREKRNQYSMKVVSDQVSWSEHKIESKILWKVQEDSKYAHSDTRLTLDFWIEEAEDRWNKSLSELSFEEKKKMTKPESISGTRRKLTRQGFLSPDAEVQEERMRKADRFQDYFRRIE